MLLEFGQRRVADGLDDLVVTDADSPAAVLRIQDAALDDLVPDLVPDLLVVLQPQCTGALLLPRIDGLLHDVLVGPGVDALAVDLAHRSLGEQAGTAGDAAEVAAPARQRT